MQKFREEQAVLVAVFKVKEVWWQDLKLIKRFKSKFYLEFYIQHKKTFFSTITSDIAIVYQKWVAWVKSKLYLNS